MYYHCATEVPIELVIFSVLHTNCFLNIYFSVLHSGDFLIWESFLNLLCIFLNLCFSEATTSCNHFFCLSFFLSGDSHELCGSMMSAHLITEVKQQWVSTWMDNSSEF